MQNQQGLKTLSHALAIDSAGAYNGQTVAIHGSLGAVAIIDGNNTATGLTVDIRDENGIKRVAIAPGAAGDYVYHFGTQNTNNSATYSTPMPLAMPVSGQLSVSCGSWAANSTGASAKFYYTVP